MSPPSAGFFIAGTLSQKEQWVPHVLKRHGFATLALSGLFPEPHYFQYFADLKS